MGGVEKEQTALEIRIFEIGLKKRFVLPDKTKELYITVFPGTCGITGVEE